MPSYRSISPVIQSQWYTCWAASMSWWTLAMQDRGRGFMSEQDILDKFPFSWDKNGAMTLKGLYDIFKTPKFMMKHRVGSEDDFIRLIANLTNDPVKASKAFPIVIGYNDKNVGGNHISVLCEFDIDPIYRKFIVMDPAKASYRARSKDYFLSQTMVFGWAQEAGDIIYG